ncbi:MAG: 16S rRNA (uracil(1498)-N(3))-methyltransferase [Chitinophagales bacterium]
MMTSPFFYITEYDSSQKQIVLDEDTSKHIVQVLRMKTGEKINLTDGKGNLLTAEITDAHKKHCTAEVKETRNQQPATRNITIAISLLKNTNRFEWFLEKATEIGVNEIIPLICERTEKEKFRHERLQSVLISAMLQSQQCWLPILHEPIELKKVVEESHHDQKFIAHCNEGEKRNLADLVNENLSSQIILVGPEGDFTKEEIDFAIQHHFTAVSLGDTRLRAETAGIVAATLLCIS